MSPAGGGPRGAAERLLPIVPALLAPAAALLAIASGGAFALPVLATAAVWPVFALLLLRGRPRAAALAALLWAACLSATIIAVTARDPARAGGAIVNGPAYRDEMFGFIATGVGRESDPARFVPQHLLHLTVFCVLSVASGGLLGLALGAVLVGFMSFYVGALAAGPEPITAAVFGWPPWAVLRVAGFILLGTVLARPLLFGVTGRPSGPFALRPWVRAATALLLLDIALKALFASRWAEILRPCLGGG